MCNARPYFRNPTANSKGEKKITFRPSGGHDHTNPTRSLRRESKSTKVDDRTAKERTPLDLGLSSESFDVLDVAPE